MRKVRILNIDSNNYVKCPALIKCNIQTVSSVYPVFLTMSFNGKEKKIQAGSSCTECKSLIMIDEKRKKILCGY